MRKQTFFLLVVAFLLSLSIWVFDTASIVQFSYGITQKVFLPTKGFLSSLQQQNPDQEIEKLREENQMLVAKLIEQEELKKENAALRSQFEDSPIDQQELMPVNIVGFRGSHENPDEIIIDQGSEAGVRSGMPVISGDNLVGIVEYVSLQFSSVILPSHQSFRILARNPEESASGIVTGSEGVVLLSEVVITDTLNIGDVIVTAGNITNREYGIINGLVVGSVVAIQKEEAEAFQSAEIEPKVNVKSLSKVFVVTSK